MFPNGSLEKKFGKILSKIPERGLQEKVMKEVEKLEEDPRPGGKRFKALTPPVSLMKFTAEYRIRIGNYRVLYDVDDKRKIVWILALRKRDEGTYR